MPRYSPPKSRGVMHYTWLSHCTCTALLGSQVLHFCKLSSQNASNVQRLPLLPANCSLPCYEGTTLGGKLELHLHLSALYPSPKYLSLQSSSHLCYYPEDQSTECHSHLPAPALGI